MRLWLDGELAGESMQPDNVNMIDAEVALAPGGPYAKIMAGQNVVAIVGDSGFVHGGIIPGVATENEKRKAQEEALAASDQALEVTQGAGTATTAAAAAQDTPAPEAVGSKAWVKPLNSSYVLTSGYAWRWGKMHPAQDFAIPVGTPVKAMSSGVVIFAGWSGGYGNKVEIKYLSLIHISEPTRPY